MTQRHRCADWPTTRPPAPLLLKLGAVAVICLAIAFIGMSYDMIGAATPVTQWPNADSLRWTWPANCDASKGTGPATLFGAEHSHPESAVSSANFFTLHMFYMSLAFGLLAPIGSVVYIVLEDTVGLPHTLVKWLHALVLVGAILCSILGYLQAYYSNGGACQSMADHFLSLHSYMGIVLLAAYWLQGPLALLIFSNKALLRPGTAARYAFAKAHVIVGEGLNLLALVVILLGIVAFETKRNQWLTGEADHEIWYKMARAGMVAFGLLVVLFAVLAAKPSPATAAANKVDPINTDALTLLPPAATPPGDREVIAAAGV